jgi:hypothetical protein
LESDSNIVGFIRKNWDACNFVVAVHSRNKNSQCEAIGKDSRRDSLLGKELQEVNLVFGVKPANL